MFKIGTGRTAWIAVKWDGLAEDGSTVENEIRCKVKLVDRDVLQGELTRERNPGADPAHTVEFCKENTTDWSGVGDEGGSVLPFTPDNFHRLIQTPGFLFGWGQAYLTAWGGQSGIREKNLESSPDAGSAAGQANQPTEA